MLPSLNKDNLKTAIFGYGKMGRFHETALSLTRDSTVTAVSDPIVDDSVKEDLDRRGIEHYVDPSQLLAQVQPDVVHICTPPDTHEELALLAIKAGAHVYVEKPFALSANSARRILHAAERTGLKVCAGHQLLFEETAIELHSTIPLLGTIAHIESYFSFRQVRKNLTPAEQLMDILPHPVYMLQSILHLKGLADECDLSDIVVRPCGEARCLLKDGDMTGFLLVSLNARLVESYLKIVGHNGTIIADFVRNTILQLPDPGASAFDAIINPYRLSKQLAVKTTKAFAKRAIKKQKSYPGLLELINGFHEAIIHGKSSPVSPHSILQTVELCERIGHKLMNAHEEQEKLARTRIERISQSRNKQHSSERKILFTGGTGFLRSKVVEQLIRSGHTVRVLSRSLPSYTKRFPGVEYSRCDLGSDDPSQFINNIDLVIHCAAETSGGKSDHKRNSIDATRNLIKAVHRLDVKKFIFVSSIAVLKSSKALKKPLSESSPVDSGNLSRGPYVWGKAESERICSELAKEFNMNIKIIRPGPLVDFQHLNPPGRLGRKIGPIFVAVGNKNSQLAVCDVSKAATIISHYVDNFLSMPDILNLIDPVVPTRKQLTTQLIKQHPYISVVWLPQVFLNLLTPPFLALQKLLLHKKEAIRINDAFASEVYDSDLARKIYFQASESFS